MTLVRILKYTANRVTGFWMRCIRLLNFEFAKSLVGIKLFE